MDKVQVRWYSGKIERFSTVREALVSYAQDKGEVCKISFNGMRWRPKFKKDVWDNEDCLENLSESYRDERNPISIFFVLQDVIPSKKVFMEILSDERAGLISRQEADRRIDRACLRQVLTEQAFYNLYA